MSSQIQNQYGFYHEESKTFFYFETELEFNQFLELYNRYEPKTESQPQIEEQAQPNFDTFNSVFEDINSTSFDTGEELYELDF